MTITRSRGASARHVLTLVTGTTLAQVVALAASPLLTRLYVPGQFGVFALYMSVVTLLATAATGRYELAVVLPDSDEEAWHTGTLALSLALATSVACGLFVWTLAEPLARRWGVTGDLLWLRVLPLAVLLASVSNTLVCWANRRRRYAQIASNRLAQSVTTAAASVALGAAAQGSGLVWGSVIGQAVSAAMFAFGLRGEGPRGPLQRGLLREMARRYRNFPRINLPHALLDAAQASALLALLGLVFGGVALGLYALALRIVKTPLGMLGASVGQVFQQRAAQLHNEGGDLRGLVRRTTLKLAALVAPIALAMVFAPWLFAWVFGEQWREAGVYALILAPWMALNFIASPLSQLPLIVGQQARALLYGLAYQAAMLLPFGLALLLPLSMRQALGLQSLLASLALLFYGAWLMRLADNTKHAHG
ncbi:MAG TPA: oligosaccharide flippase family protein [Albitalea sp.]|nr:oligosaccharide flippase family protein [Albitalea sp.]